MPKCRLSILFGSKLYEVITVFKKIMVATDGSETSMRTAKLAVSLARLAGGRVAAIYVVDIYRLAQLPGYTTLPGLSERLMGLMLKEGDEATSEIGEMASDAGVPFEKIIAEGNPSEEILRQSKESGIDLLVMGSIGRTGLEKIMLGSVAEKVVRHSKVPVLIVPGKSNLKI
jgi:nucleotide-binding universal stress UspA family protein